MASSIVRQVCIGSVCLVAPHPENAYRPYLLRHPVLAFLSAFLIATKAGAILLLSLAPEVAALSTISASFLVRQTNAARAEAGLPALTEHPLLVKSAKLKAEDMLRDDYFEHTSPTGKAPWKLFDDAGYNYVYAGENLAIDFTTGEAVRAAWMKSPGHQQNILSDKYRDIGIAVVTGEFQGRTTTVVVQHFGSLSTMPAKPRPTPALPQPSPTPPAETKPARPSPTPSPVTPPPPEILEPTEGQLLPSGASTVRGTSHKGSTVNLALDGSTTGTYPASDGTFRGTFTPPSEEEREAILTATATLNGKRSAPSRQRRVVLDTRGPTVAGDSAIVLPDPNGNAGTRLLLIPLEGKPVHVASTIGGKNIPLTLLRSVARATIDARAADQPIVVRAEDAPGNIRVVTVRALPRFQVTPRTAGESDAREKLQTMTGRLQTFATLALTVVALLLVINIFVYVRIQHADLIAHALFVIGLGFILTLIT